MRFLLLIGLLFIVTSVSGAADKLTSQELDRKQIYELKERCGDRAETYFKKKYGNGIKIENGTVVQTNYSNHYNTKLNKCFIRIISNVATKNNKTKSFYAEYSLVDINDNRQYGNAYVTTDKDKTETPICEVLNITCHSHREWLELVKPYMEE
jgi:hypothetical protein